MKLTVDKIPMQITMDQWGESLVYNDGPSTVYLGSNSSLTPDSGVPLAPKASTLWRAGDPLWGVTKELDTVNPQSSLTTLVVSRSSFTLGDYRTDTEGVLFQSILPSSAGFAPIMETGGYKTLRLSWSNLETKIGRGTTNGLNLTVYWVSQDLLQVITTDTISLYKVEKTVTSVETEVKAPYALVVYSGAKAGETLNVTGSTRVGSFPRLTEVNPAVSAVGSERVFDMSGDPVETYNVGDGVVLNKYNPTKLYGFYNPSRFLTLTLTARNYVPTSGKPILAILAADVPTNVVATYDVLTLPTTPLVGNDVGVYSKTFEVPMGSRMYLQILNGVIEYIPSFALSFVWR